MEEREAEKGNQMQPVSEVNPEATSTEEVHNFSGGYVYEYEELPEMFSSCVVWGDEVIGRLRSDRAIVLLNFEL